MPAKRKPGFAGGWRIRAMGLLLAGAAVLGGCGGSSSSPARVSSELSVSLQHAASLLRDGHIEDALTMYTSVAAHGKTQDERAQALLGSAVARAQDGDTSGALSVLQQAVKTAPKESEVRRQASYLLGEKLEAAGKHAQARDLLKPLAGLDVSDAFQPYLLAEFAQAASASGQPKDAAKAWGRLLDLSSATTALKLTAYRALAANAKDAGDKKAYLSWLKKAVDAGGATSDRLAYALAAKDAGDTTTFANQLSTIITGSPSTPEATLAVVALKAAGETVDPGAEGLVDYRHGDYGDAEQLLQPAAADPATTPAQRAFRAYYLAAAYEDSGDAVDALATYDQVVQADPGSEYAHRARYWAAHVMEETGDIASASARYIGVVKNSPPGEFTAESAFRAGYILLSKGNAQGALLAWAKIGPSKDPRLLYWEGRAYAQTGQQPLAEGAFRAAEEANPGSFWGLEAARKLGKIKPLASVPYRPLASLAAVDWPAIEKWLEAKTPGKLPDEPQGAVASFLAIGLRGQASGILMTAAEGAGPWRLLALTKEAHDAGLTDTAARLAALLASSVHANDPASMPRSLLQLVYPLDYVASLTHEAQARGIDPLFLAALVWQESLWNPSAGSTAGALGLTQVIPETGSSIAATLRVANFQPDDLYRPDLSLQFGAYYLAEQLHAFAKPYVALAAYNAGPGNAIRWVDGMKGDSIADFVAAMDFDETASYVTKIVEAYAAYQKAYRG